MRALLAVSVLSFAALTLLPLEAESQRQRGRTVSQTSAGRLASAEMLDSATVRSYMGTWDGRIFMSEQDADGLGWRIVHWSSESGAVDGNFVFTNSAMSPAVARVISVRDSSAVIEAGPYHSGSLNTDVVLRLEGIRRDESLAGTYEIRSTVGTVLRRGKFQARRTP